MLLKIFIQLDPEAGKFSLPAFNIKTAFVFLNDLLAYT